ncbi:SUMF1/EgtB/PvdO family nonheme iron enzyme [Rhizobium leguminosarum]|uniref:SUMF1/EgtB/PvdO family nonheme iron enzyme n=1 Tax=Rhizobium TaxID=379 RepID=UPI00140F8DF3|nr:SUMF1/EgtB/PvdO family nonheme iron enzyme [Rhizobium leguminosarum]QIO64282.1 SUMF1/EgtB/PvdO family nonheme iron enzyme [Rhizobium leguminosarum bv. trifolii]
MARRAVVFGSNGPASSGALQYAQDDARRIAAVLRHPRCGFEVSEPAYSLKPQEIEDVINATVEACSADDTFAVFFSGHGFIDRGRLLLMLDETDVKRPLTTAIHAESILQALRYCDARHKILILDCCHAGMIFSDSRFKSGSGTRMDSVVGKMEDDSESFVAVMASDRLERAREFDRFRGSFLTSSICQALHDHIEEADADGDGAIDLSDLKVWLTDQARSHNIKYVDEQVPVPFVYGRERGQLFLTLRPEEWRPYIVTGPNDHSFALLPAMADDHHAWMIGTTPVTNSQYRAFVKQTKYSEPEGQAFVDGARWSGPFRPWHDPNFSAPDQPVVCVNFDDADNYAEWYSEFGFLGVELARTDIWDMAAFGAPHPSFDRRHWLCGEIYDQASAPAKLTDIGRRANKFGVADLFGNVWEWTVSGTFERAQIASIASTEDWDRRNQQVRGGSFLDNLAEVSPVMTAAAMREGTATKHSDLGFRLCGKIGLWALPPDIATRMERAPRLQFKRQWSHIARSA